MRIGKALLFSRAFFLIWIYKIRTKGFVLKNFGIIAILALGTITLFLWGVSSMYGPKYHQPVYQPQPQPIIINPAPRYRYPDLNDHRPNMRPGHNRPSVALDINSGDILVPGQTSPDGGAIRLDGSGRFIPPGMPIKS